MLIAGPSTVELDPIIETDPEPALPLADGFDFPVGAPDADGYVDLQPFGGTRHHLGSDWNARGRNDFGDPVYVVANGWVSMVENLYGGWGKVVTVVHRLPNGKEVESLYAHFDTVAVEYGDTLVRGQVIGTVGDAEGVYGPHLHFELRDEVGLGVGGGYGEDEGYLNPTRFIEANRPK
jgi:murein DD-endopeptidase MepM/ murein hydrolase activator NlpD